MNTLIPDTLDEHVINASPSSQSQKVLMASLARPSDRSQGGSNP